MWNEGRTFAGRRLAADRHPNYPDADHPAVASHRRLRLRLAADWSGHAWAFPVAAVAYSAGESLGDSQHGSDCRKWPAAVSVRLLVVWRLRPVRPGRAFPASAVRPRERLAMQEMLRRVSVRGWKASVRNDPINSSAVCRLHRQSRQDWDLQVLRRAIPVRRVRRSVPAFRFPQLVRVPEPARREPVSKRSASAAEWCEFYSHLSVPMAAAGPASPFSEQREFERRHASSADPSWPDPSTLRPDRVQDY
jgi:hypothetical protein